MKQCPHCTQEIQDDATVCHYCQREVAAASTTPIITLSRPVKIVIWLVLIAAFVLYEWHNYGQQRQQVEAYNQKLAAWNAKCHAFVGTSASSPIAKQCYEEQNAMVAKAWADGLRIPEMEFEAYNQKVEAYNRKVEAYSQKVDAWNAKCPMSVVGSPLNPLAKQCYEELTAMLPKAKADGLPVDDTVETHKQKVEASKAYNQKVEAWTAKCSASLVTSPASPLAKQCEDERNALVAKAKADRLVEEKK